MATSSIIENIQINNPKVMEDYISAIERAESAPIETNKTRIAREIRDPDEIKKILERGIEKWGRK